MYTESPGWTNAPEKEVEGTEVVLEDTPCAAVEDLLLQDRPEPRAAFRAPLPTLGLDTKQIWALSVLCV